MKIRKLIPLFVSAAALLGCLSVSAQQQSGEQLLAKYNFEGIPAHIPNWGAGFGSYKPATGWKTPFIVSLDTVDPHSGTNSMLINLEAIQPDESGKIKERIVHSPGIKLPEGVVGTAGKVIVRLSLKSEGVVPGGVGIRVLERGGNKSLGLLGNKNNLIVVEQGEGWIELEAEASLRRSADMITFMVVVNPVQQTPAKIWIDDISLEFVPNS